MNELKDKVVLIVDDEERNVFALSSYLGAQDMEVIVARNGEEALIKMMEQPRPDIVLLDMMMPVMDGYEALRVIRQEEKYSGIPVIAVTAKAMKGDREKCLEAGAHDYMPKPVNITALIEKMKHWMQ